MFDMTKHTHLGMIFGTIGIIFVMIAIGIFLVKNRKFEEK